MPQLTIRFVAAALGLFPLALLATAPRALPWGTCGIETALVDDNHDGYHDGIRALVHVETDVSLRIAGSLVLDDGTILLAEDLRYKHTALPRLQPYSAGRHTLMFHVAGAEIRKSAVDGPYTFRCEIAEVRGEARPDASRAQPSPEVIEARTVAVDALAFEGPFAHFGKITLATEGPRPYRQLLVEPAIELEHAGQLTVDLALHAAGVPLYETSRTLKAQMGPTSIAFRIPGPGLFVSRKDGPYEIELVLTDAHGFSETRHLTTEPLASNDFAPPAASFTRRLHAAPTAIGADVAADALRVTAEIAATKTGTWSVEGRLFRSDGSYLCDLPPTPVRAMANTTGEVAFAIPGERLFRARSDGPYTVELLLKEGIATLDRVEWQTAPYRHHEFSRPMACLTGEASDELADTDGDGTHDTLRLLVGVEVFRSGRFRLGTTLFNPNNPHQQVHAETETRVDTPGLVQLPIDFSAEQVRTLNGDGPYRFHSITLDGEGRTVDQSSLRDRCTRGHAMADLVPRSLYLVGNFAERPEDPDRDGDFDWLVIEFDILAPRAGPVRGSATLHDVDTQPVAQFVAQAPPGNLPGAKPGHAPFSREPDPGQQARRPLSADQLHALLWGRPRRRALLGVARGPVPDSPLPLGRIRGIDGSHAISGGAADFAPTDHRRPAPRKLGQRSRPYPLPRKRGLGPDSPFRDSPPENPCPGVESAIAAICIRRKTNRPLDPAATPNPAASRFDQQRA